MNFSSPCPSSVKLIRKLRSLDRENKLNFTLIEKAIYWAKKYHDGQYRKSGEPYYTHPLEVAYLVADYRLNTEIIVASILHDIVEDTEVTLPMIYNNFDQRVSEIVEHVSRDRPNEEKISVQCLIQQAYKRGDTEALIVKLMDRLHNLITLDAKCVKKREITAKETLKSFLTLVIHLGEKTPSILSLEDKISELCYPYLIIRPAETAPQELMIFEDNFQLSFPEFQNA